MATWKIDNSHSEIFFKVKHLMITTVTGNFTGFSAEINTENDAFSNAKISFFAETNSISTGNEQRDGHLKSDDFFAAEKFPTISFTSDNFNAESGKITGNLKIRDVVNTITLDAAFGGVAKDPWGNVKAGFSLSGKINRKEFGLSWGAVTEAGNVVVSDEVRLFCEVQFVKSAE
jgi:polyisoprenoid-binding protein YceI